MQEKGTEISEYLHKSDWKRGERLKREGTVGIGAAAAATAGALLLPTTRTSSNKENSKTDDFYHQIRRNQCNTFTKAER